MFRGFLLSWRPLLVWLAVTAAGVVVLTAVPPAWHDALVATGTAEVADSLVALCASALALALSWLWVITTATVAGLLTGRSRAGGGSTRRLVLLACGAAVVVGSSVPAMAVEGDGSELLVGLSLPERAVAPTVHGPARPTPTASAPTPVAAEVYVVRPGDSLWSIALAHGGPHTSTDQRWRAIWRANRQVVGHDPDLIHPGQALGLPTEPDDTDGDRR